MCAVVAVPAYLRGLQAVADAKRKQAALVESRRSAGAGMSEVQSRFAAWASSSSDDDDENEGEEQKEVDEAAPASAPPAPIPNANDTFDPFG